ncbi:MAG: hypothetical protein QOH79_487, partial [Acidimicrobiaceae bacterium]
RVAAIITNAGLDFEFLWLEVTETVLITDFDQASATLHSLADRGVGISIDDFGTGWASLTYLKSFPIHVLKIDRSFVADIDQSADGVAIVRSILALGAELGHVVVAEGIETQAQQEALQALGCLIGQGYLYGRPTPADQVPLRSAAHTRLASTGT